MTAATSTKYYLPGYTLSLFLLLWLLQLQVASASASLRVGLKNGRDSQCQGLWAKEHIQVGSVCIEPDRRNPEQLIVAFATADGWRLEDAHLWLGHNITDMPLEDRTESDEFKEEEAEEEAIASLLGGDIKSTPTTPALSQFPYVKNDLEGEHNHFGFVVKLFYLNYICPDSKGTQFSAVAHATVSATRSGLRNSGVPTTASAWASKFHLASPPTGSSSSAETASNPISFDFSLVCDMVAERPENAPERHHANYVPS